MCSDSSGLSVDRRCVLTSAWWTSCSPSTPWCCANIGCRWLGHVLLHAPPSMPRSRHACMPPGPSRCDQRGCWGVTACRILRTPWPPFPSCWTRCTLALSRCKASVQMRLKICRELLPFQLAVQLELSSGALSHTGMRLCILLSKSPEIYIYMLNRCKATAQLRPTALVFYAGCSVGVGLRMLCSLQSRGFVCSVWKFWDTYFL